MQKERIKCYFDKNVDTLTLQQHLLDFERLQLICVRKGNVQLFKFGTFTKQTQTVLIDEHVIHIHDM